VLDRMASSAQPGYAQAFGSMLTALDNIQDALSTAATLGRIAAWPTLAGLARISPTLAAKVGARLIPGIGWMLAAADLLNLLTWLGLGGLIGYGLLCGGPRAGLAPAVVQALTRGVSGLRPCGGKAAAAAVAETNPFASKNLLKNSAKAAGKLPGFGKWAEVAQTTDQLFGRGLSFGAMYGAVMEAAYAAFGASGGQGVRVNPPAGSGVAPYRGPGSGTLDSTLALGALAEFAPEQLRAMHRLHGGALRARWQLARVLIDAPMLLAEQSILNQQDRARVLCAWLHANDCIGRDLAGADVDGLVTWALDLELAPLAVVSDSVRDQLAHTADGGDSVGRWPLPGAPRSARGADLVEYWSAELPLRLVELLGENRENVAGMWFGLMFNRCGWRAFQTLTQEAEPFRTRYAPDFVILTSLMDASRYPAVGGDPDQLWCWWLELRAIAEDEDRRSFTPRELDQSAVRHGVLLLLAEQAFLRDRTI
jgi:hypothetical protein